jgi:hypothetical protein
MRQMISGLVAAVAVMAAAPAMACGYGPCGAPYVAPIVSYNYSSCCGGWVHERLPDPVQQFGYYGDPSQQYYYVNQGPTYTGPGNWAPLPVYREDSVYSYRPHRYYRPWRPRVGYYHAPRYRYGYAPRPAPYYHGQRVLRRYY